MRCTLSGHDAHLWEQDAVELMIDPDGDGKNYFELQLSPTELVFDTRFDSRRQPQPFGHATFSVFEPWEGQTAEEHLAAIDALLNE